jgi:hypothetical protein
MRVADLIAHTSCCFADDLYPVKHRVLQQFVGVEARPIVLDVAPDPTDRGQDVRQTLTVVSQGDGLGQNPVPNARLQATRRSHVHMTADDLFNIDPGGLFGFYAARPSSRRARWLVRRLSSGVPVQ